MDKLTVFLYTLLSNYNVPVGDIVRLIETLDKNHNEKTTYTLEIKKLEELAIDLANKLV